MTWWGQGLGAGGQGSGVRGSGVASGASRAVFGPGTSAPRASTVNHKRAAAVEQGGQIGLASGGDGVFDLLLDQVLIAVVLHGVEDSERLGEVGVEQPAEQKGDGLGGGKKDNRGVQQMTAAQIKAQLLKTAPSQATMLRQVTREIEKEIKYLNKRARKIIRKPGSVNAFELNNIVKKIRELKSLLISLAKATVDAVKTLWLRFVHGVM